MSGQMHSTAGAAGDTRGMGGFAIDANGPFIRVTGTGFWSPEIVDAHFARLRTMVANRRQPGKGMRSLVDLRGAEVQSPETVARVGAGSSSLYQPGDRVAIVVASSLAKMQMRRIIDSMEHEFFVSPDAALTWLMAR